MMKSFAFTWLLCGGIPDFSDALVQPNLKGNLKKVNLNLFNPKHGRPDDGSDLAGPRVFLTAVTAAVIAFTPIQVLAYTTDDTVAVEDRSTEFDNAVKLLKNRKQPQILDFDRSKFKIEIKIPDEDPDIEDDIELQFDENGKVNIREFVLPMEERLKQQLGETTKNPLISKERIEKDLFGKIQNSLVSKERIEKEIAEVERLLNDNVKKLPPLREYENRIETLQAEYEAKLEAAQKELEEQAKYLAASKEQAIKDLLEKSAIEMEQIKEQNGEQLRQMESSKTQEIKKVQDEAATALEKTFQRSADEIKVIRDQYERRISTVDKEKEALLEKLQEVESIKSQQEKELAQIKSEVETLRIEANTAEKSLRDQISAWNAEIEKMSTAMKAMGENENKEVN